LYGYGGDDTFNITSKSGSFIDTINGGSGTNTLSISYDGITGLGSFASIIIPTSESSPTMTLIDVNGGTINFESILTWEGEMKWDGYLTVSDNTYRFVSDNRYDLTPFSGAYGSVYAFLYQSGSDVEVVLPDGGKFMPQYRMSSYRDFTLNGNETYTVYGTSGNEVIFTGYQADTITAGAGNDYIFAGDGADTIYAGDGNDVVYLSHNALSEDVVIDGGSGSNTLAFNKPGEAGGWDNDSYGAITFDLTSPGKATGFVNVVGTAYDDNITGDSSANVLIGASGADILKGSSGNDSLYGDYHTGDTSGTIYGFRQYGVSEGNDTLYGGGGDDILVANSGDDVLDGGTGKDIQTGGSGIDTFVIRSGDGSTTLANADVITDFEDGTDLIGMDDGLQYSDLSIEQGTANYLNDTFVSITSTGEYLAIVEGISASVLTEVYFTPVDIL